MSSKVLYCLIILFSLQISAAEKIGLKVGDKAPLIKTKDIHGKVFKLIDHKDPILLVFYRGGWCPYCNMQLKKLQNGLLPKIKKHGVRIVAISVDRASEGAKTQKSRDLDMTIISDPSAKIVKDYNLVYKVPEDLVKKYKNQYSIDLEAASGEKHHILPVPAVFLVFNGNIHFAYANKDYKVRTKHEDILAAVEKLKVK